MSFSFENVKTITRSISDPGADNKQVHLFRAPQSCEILRAYISVQNAQGAGSAGAFQLENWGTAGTAVAGTVAAAEGGTASADRLAAATPVAYTLTDGTLAAGEWLVLDYQETGDFVEGQVTITFDYVDGIGA